MQRILHIGYLYINISFNTLNIYPTWCLMTEGVMLLIQNCRVMQPYKLNIIATTGMQLQAYLLYQSAPKTYN